MSYHSTSAKGSIEAVIDDNCGMKQYFSIANMLISLHKVKFVAKEDYSDTVDWYFTYKGHRLNLHYNIYNGVSICDGTSKDNEVVKELAISLRSKLV